MALEVVAEEVDDAQALADVRSSDGGEGEELDGEDDGAGGCEKAQDIANHGALSDETVNTAAFGNGKEAKKHKFPKQIDEERDGGAEDERLLEAFP